MGKFLILLFVVVAVVAIYLLLRSLRRAPQNVAQPNQPTPSDEPTGAARENWLLGLDGVVAGKTFHIGQRTTTIGRGTNNFVQIMDNNVSRVHARLSPAPGGMRVQDLSSKFGVLINDQPINDAILHDGDHLKIGSVGLLFRRQGDFDANAGLGRKAIGDQAVLPTMLAGSDELVEALALRALQQSNGDVIRAAQLSKLSIDVIEKYARKQKP